MATAWPGSKPRKTTPTAPRPNSESSLYGPIDSIGRSIGLSIFYRLPDSASPLLASDKIYYHAQKGAAVIHLN